MNVLLKFLETRVVQDRHAGTARETRYEKDKVYDLPEASAEHWLTRKAALRVEPKAKADKAKS